MEKAPPAAPNLGSTFLSEVSSVTVERGRYSRAGKYWPVKVRVKGDAQAKLTGLLQLTLADAAATEKPQLTEFVVEGRFSRVIGQARATPPGRGHPGSSALYH